MWQRHEGKETLPKKIHKLEAFANVYQVIKYTSDAGKTLPSFNYHCNKPKTSEFLDYQTWLYLNVNT